MPINQKFTELTEDAAPTSDDLVAVANDPAGTPGSKKVSLANLTKALSAVVGDSGSGGTKGLVPAPAAGDTAAGKFLKADGTFAVPATGGAGGIGDVVGPASATDNAISRYDSTTGKLIQDSVVIVSDAGAITVPEIAAPSTPASGTVHIYAKSDGKLYIKDDTGVETDLAGSGGSIAPLQLTDANTVEQYNGTTIQVHRLYATRTSSTDYEALKTYFHAGNGAFRIEAEKGSGGGNFRQVFIVVSDNLYQFNPSSFIPPGDSATALGGGSNYWVQSFIQDMVVKSGGNVRWNGTAWLTSPFQGLLNIKDSSGNGGSGTIQFDSRTMAQITSNQNNYAVTVPGYFVRLSSDASRDITGLIVGAANRDGQVHRLVNVGTQPIVLKQDDANSTATNRFYNSTGADITLTSTGTSKEAADIIYDNTLQRWLVYKP